MDFVFNCASCQGPLIARTNLRGLIVQCAHCAGGVEFRTGRPVTEAVVSALLDAPLPAPPASQPVLRRVRPAVHHSSAGIHPPRTRLPRPASLS